VDSFLLVFAAVYGLAIQAMTHVLILRFVPSMRPFMAYLTAFFVGLIATITADAMAGWGAASWTRCVDIALPDVLAYMSLGYSYFHFFNMSETGRRMRLMIELHLAVDGLTPEELLRRYSAEDVVNVRVARMLSAGHVIERAGRLYGFKRSLSLATQAILFLKWLTIGQMAPRNEYLQGAHDKAIGEALKRCEDNPRFESRK
jgi:hypothetical protein